MISEFLILIIFILFSKTQNKTKEKESNIKYQLIHKS